MWPDAKLLWVCASPHKRSITFDFFPKDRFDPQTGYGFLLVPNKRKNVCPMFPNTPPKKKNTTTRFFSSHRSASNALFSGPPAQLVDLVDEDHGVATARGLQAPRSPIPRTRAKREARSGDGPKIRAAPKFLKGPAARVRLDRSKGSRFVV